MANTPQKTMSNNKVYQLKDGTESISFKPNSRKPKNKTYKSLVIFKGNIDFGEEIEWLGGKPESFPTDSVSIVELIQNTSDKIYAHVFGGSSSGNGGSENKYTKWLVCLDFPSEIPFFNWKDKGGKLVNTDISLSLVSGDVSEFVDFINNGYAVVEFREPMDAISVQLYMNTQVGDYIDKETANEKIVRSIGNHDRYFHLCWSVHSPVID